MGIMTSVKRYFWSGLCLVALVSIGLNIIQYRQAAKTHGIPSGHSGSEKPVDPYHTPEDASSASVNSLENATEALKYQLEAAREELAIVNRQIAEFDVKKAEEKEAEAEQQKETEKEQGLWRQRTKARINTPLYQKQMMSFIESENADLFEELDLTPEALQGFVELWCEQMTAKKIILLSINGNTITEEDREKLSKSTEEYEAKKAELLGEENYEIYRYYMDSGMERYVVQNYETSLRSEDRLADSQVYALVRAMYDAGYEEIVLDRENTSESELRNQILENEYRKNEAYIEAANQILTESQAEAFDKYLFEETEKIKMQWERSDVAMEIQTME